MDELDARCMKRLPRKRAQRLRELDIDDSGPARLTIRWITNYRPSASGEMNADLMPPPGHEPASEQREPRARRRDPREPFEPRQARGAH